MVFVQFIIHFTSTKVLSYWNIQPPYNWKYLEVLSIPTSPVMTNEEVGGARKIWISISVSETKRLTHKFSKPFIYMSIYHYYINNWTKLY
jgi:hypothetical protein